MTLNLKKDDFQAFFEAPFNAYGEVSPYVSPLKADLKRFLDRGRNPLFQGASDLCFFTAHRDGRAIGRITAHVHAESNALHGVNWGYFGYFDCADDAEDTAGGDALEYIILIPSALRERFDGGASTSASPALPVLASMSCPADSK